MAEEVIGNTVWKFKKGKGDRFRRLRILDVCENKEVKLRSFYLDEPPRKKYRRRYQTEGRRQPKTITLQLSTLLKDYECVTTNRHEPGIDLSILVEGRDA